MFISIVSDTFSNMIFNITLKFWHNLHGGGIGETKSKSKTNDPVFLISMVGSDARDRSKKVWNSKFLFIGID